MNMHIFCKKKGKDTRRKVVGKKIQPHHIQVKSMMERHKGKEVD